MRGVLATVLLLALAGWEPFRSPNSDVEAGNKAFVDGRFDDALSAYDKAARDKAVDADGLAYNRGSALVKKSKAKASDPAEATRLQERGMEDLKQAATSRDPKVRAGANFNRGNVQLETNKLEEAIESYKQALRDQPKFDDARLNLELALRRREKQQQQQQQGGQGQQGQGQQGQQQGQGQGQQQGQQGQQGQQQGQGQGQGSNQQQQQGQGQQQGQQGQGQGSNQPHQGQGQGQGSNQQQQGQGGGSGSNQPPQQGQQGQQPPQQGQKRRDRTEHPQGPRTPRDRKLDDLEDFSRGMQRDGARRRASGRSKDPDKDW